LIESLGGKELMVKLALTVWEVQLWNVRGERWGGWAWLKGVVKGTRARVRWEVKVGFRVNCNCRVWGDKSSSGENWG
jgi:hypothetical protein